MKTLVTSLNRKLSIMGLFLLFIVASASNALATAGAVETALTTAVTDAKTSAEAILAVVATVLAAFLLFKLGKRAANKV